MDENSIYAKGIQLRSRRHFWLGVLARIKNYYINKYAVYVARKNGAIIGEDVSLPLALAKKANTKLTVGNRTSIQTINLDLRAPITIGSKVIIGSGVKIITCSHNIDSPDWEFKPYGITIEDYVWIATDVLILPSCTKIKRGAVIGSGSVVAKNVDTMHIVSGNPATFLRERKDIHYNLCVEGLLGNDLKTYLKARKGLLD